MQRRVTVACKAAIACGLAALAAGAGGSTALLPSSEAQAQAATARNVTSVSYQGGQFRQTGPKTWTENNGAFNFTEVSRDASSVVLLDESRGVRLQLNIVQKQIFYSDGGNKNFVPLYAITSVSAQAVGGNPGAGNAGGGAGGGKAGGGNAGGGGTQPPTPVGNIQTVMLTAHNAHRAKHCVPAVTWNANLAASAQQWANACKFAHGQSGENLSAGTAQTAQAAVDGWYAEIAKYNFAAPRWSPGVGHFTQVVWRSTTQIGCAVASCDAGTIFPTFKSFFYVCRYAPAGNVTGAAEAQNFAANVPRTCR